MPPLSRGCSLLMRGHTRTSTMRAAASSSSVAMVAAVATCLHTTAAAQAFVVVQNTNKILHNNDLPCSCCRYITSSSSSSALSFAKKKKEGKGSSNKGFGPPKKKKGPKKYTIEDKSYGIISPTTTTNSGGGSIVEEPSMEEIESSMNDFFNTYNEWKPLFRNILLLDDDDDEDSSSSSPPPMATSHLVSNDNNMQDEEEIWGISTLENRRPWRLLPSKPTTNSSLAILSTFLDELQQSLLDIPLDTIISGANDLHFLEEGRRTIAVTRFHVMEGGYEYDDWETELFRTCWSELAHLTSQDVNDTGSLILLPANANNRFASRGGDEEEEKKLPIGLDDVRQFVDTKLNRPISWLGREKDWEIVALERGSLAVRLLYKLSDIPDLSERDRSGDEDIKF